MIIYKCKDECLEANILDKHTCCAFCDYYAECNSEIKCDNKRVERCTDKIIIRSVNDEI